jgi:hypothetical protein
MMLAFGIAFEVLLLIMLNLAGILTHEARLRSKLAGRGYHRPFGKRSHLPNERWLTVRA